jgi:hypothetical protein
MRAYHQYGMSSRPVFVNYKKAALDSQPQMLKLTNCLPMVGASLRVLQLLVSKTTDSGLKRAEKASF